MTEFLKFQSVVSYRVKVNEDGTLGKPEILKAWTTKPKATKAYDKTKPKQVQATIEVGEREEM